MGNESFMKVLFDGTCITENPAGIGNYAYQLLKEFARDNKHEVTVLCRESTYIPKGEKIETIKVSNRFAKLLPFDLISAKKKYDVYHQPNYIPHKFDGKTVITVHDMSHKVYAEYHPWKRVAMLNFFEGRMKNADVILTDSESSKKEIMKYWNIASEKIHVTYLGIDARYYEYNFNAKDDFELVSKWKIPDNYILFVGTIEPRKNLQRLIRAFDMYKSSAQDDLKLVLAGGKGWLSESIYEEASKVGCANDIMFTGYFPERLKPALYAKAKALVYPSLYEGFGLPILEAMAVGTPVLTSNISSMPEVAGDMGVYVDPYEVDSIVAGIFEVMIKSFNTFYQDECRKYVKKYSWQKNYEATVSFYDL